VRIRCAMCRLRGGLLHMEIDHFNPTLKSRARNAYSNLMLATRLCNNIKKDAWPTPNDIAAGARLLNPTVEMDYGEHIFEDPDTHKLVAMSPAGSYHIDVLDLNNETFVWEREKRATYAKLRGEYAATLSGSFDEFRDMLKTVNEVFDLLIPLIPAPPGKGN